MKKTVLFLIAAVFAVVVNAQTIFSEDFQGITTNSSGIGEIPSTWTMYNDNLGNNSQANYFTTAWGVAMLNGGNKVGMSISYTDVNTPCDRWLITPAIELNNPGLYLEFKAMSNNPNYPESFAIKISTTTTEKEAFTSTLIDVASVPGTWTPYLLDLSEYEGQTVYIAFIQKSTDKVYLWIDDIKVYVASQDEIALEKVKVPGYVKQNTNILVEGIVKNNGTAALTSFDVTYNIDGGANVATYTVTGINVATYGTYTFTHNLPATISEIGTHTFNVTVSNPNGVADSTSDNVASGTTIIYDEGLQRTVLLEQFTTAKCVYCPDAHDYLKQLLASKSNVVWMTHHAGFYTDDLTIPENEEMLVFYNDGGATYAPAAMLDRTYFPEEGEPGPVVAAAISEGLLDAQISKPSFVSLNIGSASFNNATRELSITVSGNVASAMMSEFNSPRVSLYIKEDSLKINTAQSGSNLGKNYIHNNVMRATISDVWGDQGVITSTTAGSTFSKTYNYTIPATMKLKNLTLVAFVSEYNNNVNQRSVLNSKAAKLSDLVPINPTGIKEASDIAFRMYPNPATTATDHVVISSNTVIKEISVINTLGQVLYTRTVNAENAEIDIQSLVKGVYMVSVTTNEGSAVKKLTVVK